MQLTKCVVWFPHGLDHFISFPLDYFTPNVDFYILGTPIGSKSFIESFVVKTFVEDLGTIFNFLMFTNPHVTFAMFSLCYA